MSPDERLQYFAERFPQLSAMFAMFGSPDTWPATAAASEEHRASMVELFNTWEKGAFDFVPGVTPSPKLRLA
jgi:hypothetical protein